MSARRLRPAAILAPLIAVLGCASPESASDPDPARSITILVDRDERLMSPAIDEEAKFLVFLPFAVQREDGELEGRLAREWSVSDDHRTLTVRLRSDVRWHDGVPVTAEDVAFTYDLLSHPAVAYYGPEAVAAEAPDDSTVVIRFAGGVRDADLWWTVFYPRHLLEALDPAAIESWDFWLRPVGNGPYRYVRHLPETMLELEANADHFAGRPAIERVVLRFGPASLLELQAGNVDVVPYANPTAAAALAADPRFRLYHSINPGFGRALFWNQNDPLFRDVRVRRALTLAIDRRAILRALDLPGDLPLADGPYSGRQVWRGEVPEPIAHDPDEASRLLAAAGWADRDGDGVRERDGVPFRFTGTTVGAPDLQRIAVVLQEQLRGVGLAMEIELMLPAPARERWARGELSARLTTHGGPGSLRRIFGAGSPLGYDNPRVAALIEELSAAIEPEVRDGIYRELIEVFRQDAPAVFLMPRVIPVVAHRRVMGLRSPFRVFPTRHMEELWLEEEP